MFNSHKIKTNHRTNHRVLRKNKVYTHEALFLHLMIVPLFKQPKCAVTYSCGHCKYVR
jgi:hypothetical protein